MRLSVMVGTVAVLCLAGAVGAVSADAGGTAEVPADVHESSGDWCPNDRDAPDADQLGWENGCWWDAEITVDRSDGLNDTELRKVVGRSMARIERIRELEFERNVPVEVISREQHREDLAERYNVSTDERLKENVVLEAALMVGEDEDAVTVQQEMFGSATLGYYDTEEERIAIISENASTPKMDEITLSQELYHALQDERWNISSYDRRTWEELNANNGIVEGDGNYVDHLYQERCDAEWDCLMPNEDDQAGGGGSIHYGIYTMFFQPYSDGPRFVQELRESGGWEAVNQVYENPPASSEQVIYPDRYPDEEPVNVTVEDTSGETWRVPDAPDGSVPYGQLGEAGLYTTFLYPAFETEGGVRTEMAQSFYNVGPNELQDAIDPYNYTHQASEGWAGDRIYPYVTDESAETNETAYVWKLHWDSERDAAEFVSEYYWLLDYRGAEPVEGHVDTFRIPDDESFGDAFYVTQEGDEVVIVNAPSVEALTEVREGAAPAGTQDLSGTVWAENDSEAGEGSGDATATPGDDGDTGGQFGPGFGVVALVAALAALVVAILVRRE